ncbi:hypothetical protein GCM10007978_30180 [Shewanella hanedai]|uniref:DUF1439 domain-containing protein n=1 Tax=Shewanella hanedai TaxID=25 RepID=A0A553JQU3_SHEHA|nr:DUF1439 domain-containing protein [Shewanella hanedai]TRY14824.1 DUF1439 domain-containing protein [Shewanella hanedai]GGI90522.1 hypothetical protein GCM10007978_30180 [Shewanella hanedai]
MKLLSCMLPLTMLLLTGCVSQYSITEEELEGYLSDEIHFEVKEGNQLFGIEMRINNIDVELGHKADTMSVTADSVIKIKNPLVPFKANMKTTFEAEPWYDAQSHSVYLKQLTLVSIESDPKDIEKAVKQVAPQMMGFLTNFLETQPVYVLDTSESNQALIADMTKQIKVEPGKLKLIFDE